MSVYKMTQSEKKFYYYNGENYCSQCDYHIDWFDKDCCMRCVYGVDSVLFEMHEKQRKWRDEDECDGDDGYYDDDYDKYGDADYDKYSADDYDGKYVNKCVNKYVNNDDLPLPRICRI